MIQTKKRFVLFDIDGTLLHTNGLSKTIFCQGLSDVFGVPIEWGAFPYRGQTDAQLARDLLAEAHIPEAAIRADLPAAFTHMAQLWAAATASAADIVVYPGVRPLIDQLQRRDDVVIGLLTSNSRATAYCKLVVADLPTAPFEVGAFGDEATDRRKLPALALTRANERCGLSLSGADTVLVGDSPIDIICARTIGARIMSVATGRPAAQLAEHDPDYLLTDLGDTEAVLSLIMDL